MSTAWYLVPYNIKWRHNRPCRYPAMDDYTRDIYDYGGQWAETEVLRGAIVKVRCRQAVLNFLDTVEGFRRLPKDRLGQSLADLSPAVLQQMRNVLLNMGYTNDEIHEKFGGNLGNFTLGDFLRFIARRRLKPRYDRETDTIFVDGPVQECRSVESVDREVSDTDEEAYIKARKAREKFGRSMGLPLDLAQAMEQDIKQELEQNIEQLEASPAAQYALRSDMPVETQKRLLEELYPIAKAFDDLVFGSVDEEVTKD